MGHGKAVSKGDEQATTKLDAGSVSVGRRTTPVVFGFAGAIGIV